MAYEIDPTLVRGLDYYTRTVFEFESERLGAQAALGGGGRYDRLVEELGGPPTPGVGWAAGVERILLAAQDEEAAAGARVFVSHVDEAIRAFEIAGQLRQSGIHVEMEQAGRSLKGQLKQANRIGADVVVLVGDDLEVKDMGSGEQVGAADVDDALKKVEELLAEREGAS
jgi:histidyl-tRNA synthetase